MADAKRFVEGWGRMGISWPEPDTRKQHLFAARPPFRDLIVMIDEELLLADPPDHPITKHKLVSNLLRSPLVRLYRYRDDGPPADLSPLPDHPDVYEGWAVARPDADGNRRGGRAWSVTFSRDSGSACWAGVAGDAPQVAEHDDDVDAYRDLPPEASAQQRLGDAVAAQVASSCLTADMYVSEREYLHAATWGIARGTVICTPEEALPLLGLYLRAQGEFLTSARSRMNRGLFYLVATRELLSAGWRWVKACHEHDRAAPQDELALLASSMLQRVDRALVARDEVHIALNQPQHNDTRREIMSRFDDLLVDLMGALDATARVAHAVLGLPVDRIRTAGWQNARKDGWLDAVRRVDPALAAVVDSGTRNHAALTILRLLRNSVHGAAMHSIAYEHSLRAQESLARMPSDTQQEILDAMDLLGGRDTWGARQLLRSEWHLDVGAFVDRLFPVVISLLNDVMDSTPVELLAGVHLSDADRRPPVEDPRNTGVWDEWQRLSIRWQLGL